MKQSISHIISKILKQSVLQVKTVFWVKISMKFLNILFGFLIVGPLRFLFFISSFLLILNAIATDALSVQDAVRDRVVKRQNFGLIFRHVSEIFTYNDQYLHHLVLDLPPRPTNASSPLVQAAHPREMNKQPDHLVHNLTMVDPLMNAFRQEILLVQQLIDTIYDLFVEVRPAALNSRKRRYWCVFYCSDVATQTDMDLIKKYSDEAGNITARNMAKIQQALDAMASYT
jgi:hypothetical protein